MSQSPKCGACSKLAAPGTILLCDADVLRLGEEAQRFLAPKAFVSDAALFYAAASIFPAQENKLGHHRTARYKKQSAATALKREL
jgi:hypothetical protein